MVLTILTGTVDYLQRCWCSYDIHQLRQHSKHLPQF